MSTVAIQEPEQAQAIVAWQTALGAEYVDRSAETKRRYARSCGHDGYTPSVVLRPGSTAEVQAVMRIAQQFGVKVYPISRGKNSGYGSASPSAAECAIIDLSRLSRILQVDEELAFAVIEPGVTQSQLQRHLEQVGSRLWMDVTGASPESSLIGNLVERGYGLSPYGDRFLNSSGMEVVLPTGDVLNTGFGRFPDAKVTHLYKWGVGPYLDGLFTQSNFGIVTKVGIWLMPKPEASTVVSVRFESDESLLNSIERLRDLKLRGLFPSPVHIANDLRVISVFERYPFSRMEGLTPLSSAALEELKARWQVGAWNCVAGMWGARSQVASMRKELKCALKGCARPIFISRWLLRFVAQRPWLHWLPGAKDLKTKMGLLKLLEGVPSSAPQCGGYWRKKTPVPEDGPDLERDGCGIIWVSPMVPSTRSDLARFISVTREVCAAHSFETNVTVSLLTERACCCTVAIIFDRAEPGELRKAERCHEVLLHEYLKVGFPPYRAGSDWREHLRLITDPHSTFAVACRAIKSAIDPRGVLAPGRYGL